MIYLFITSLLFLISYIFLKKSKGFLIFFSFSIFVYFLLSITYISANYFTWNWVDESVIYHLLYGLDWAWFWADLKLIIFGFFLFLVWVFLSFFSYFYGKKLKNETNILKQIFFIIFFFSSFFFHPILKNFYDLGYFDFWKNSVKNEKYIVPEVKKIWKNTKNIVYIYLESFEKIYTDENIFPGLTPNLNSLKKQASFFENVDQAYGTSWTIAWMVWSQCGTPLINSGWGGNSMHWIKDFLSWAFCVWDFLKKANYELSYIWWAKLEFAWKWNFYKTHSFDNVFWRDELIKKLKNKNYENDWWLYDDSTFDFALEEFKRLQKTWKNFFLATLTLDTHWDTGVISKSCEKNIYDKNNLKNVLNAYHCSDFLVWKLVSEIRKLDKNNETIIVISSDHFAMSHNNSSHILKENQEKRRNLFMIIDWKEKNISKKSTTLDIWATVLYKAGFDVKKLWYWVNLFSNLESLPNSILKKYRTVYESFWAFPSIKSGIIFDWKNEKIILSNKEIKFPTLISLDENLETKKILWNDIDNPDSIFEQKIENSILIDFCKNKEKICVKFFSKDFFEKNMVFDFNSNINYEKILENFN